MEKKKEKKLKATPELCRTSTTHFLNPCAHKKTPKLEPVPGDLFVSATCCFNIALTGIKYCSAHSKKRLKRRSRVYKKKEKKKAFSNKHIPIADDVSTSQALVYTFTHTEDKISPVSCQKVPCISREQNTSGTAAVAL